MQERGWIINPDVLDQLPGDIVCFLSVKLHSTFLSEKLWHSYSCEENRVIMRACTTNECKNALHMTHMFMGVCVCVPELEVARLSTDGNLADLTFPQSELHGNSIQLSASTLKQHGRNGRQQISVALLPPIPKHLTPLPTVFLSYWSCLLLYESLCLLLQVRSGWPLSCTGTWAPTCPQRTRV